MCHSALMHAPASNGGDAASSSDDDGAFGGGLFAQEEADAEDDSGCAAGIFAFDAFEIDAASGRIDFYYSHRDARSRVALNRFQTALHIDFPDGVAPPGAAAAAFCCGMASLPWLWMGVPTRRILVRAATLSAEQCAFWTRAYNGSLGEFFQLHGMSYPDGVAVECDATPRELSPVRGCTDTAQPLPRVPEAAAAAGAPRRVLVPMGGGKDSLLVWELLRQCSNTQCTWFYLADDLGEYEANWRYAAIARASGTTAPVLRATHHWRCARWEAARQRRFTLCGHPWALLVACASSLAAVLHGCEAIAVGNERSAGDGNGTYRGAVVNHQYDKSLAFELPYAAYVRAHVARRLHYFSALAHLHEVQVAARFCAPPVARRYLRLFASCNEAAARPGGAPASRACGRCAKCLFVALLLAAFLEDPRDAWCFSGDDILQDASLAPILAALLGRDGATKPLDCVGTAREAALCVAYARDAYARAGLPLPALLADVAAEADAAAGATYAAMLDDADGEHAIPAWAAAACGADPTRYVGAVE